MALSWCLSQSGVCQMLRLDTRDTPIGPVITVLCKRSVPPLGLLIDVGVVLEVSEQPKVRTLYAVISPACLLIYSAEIYFFAQNNKQ